VFKHNLRQIKKFVGFTLGLISICIEYEL